MDERVALGADASEVFEDSNIPCISIISGVLRDKISSWTRVPNG